jgi:signal transduction histidine kinase
MTAASPVPEAVGGRPFDIDGPRFALRRKGLVLFLLVSLYVIGGAALLTAQAMQLVGSRQELLGRIEPLIWVAVIMTLLGLVVLGAFLTLFLGRLAADLGRLQSRALEVASGFRGAPLGIERADEVGMLARAVDKMTADLTAREAEIAAARLERFHSERMTLLGGIAAGVAHEIGNPVAGIAAIAAEAAAARQLGHGAEWDAEQLLALAQRLRAITRRLALAAGTRSKERAPIALNPVIESLSGLLALDERFKHIEIRALLDPDLPMVEAAEDDVVQLLLHLLMNAVESFEGALQDRPCVQVVTARDSDGARLEVRDNGRGMDRETLARAFEPLFTTKPAGRGNGLGLDACRRIVARNGGRIALESAPEDGTRAICRFPSARATVGTALS